MNEKPIFFSQGNHKLFGVLHYPDELAPESAFVFCHPFAEEKLWTHRVFVSFARELAARGYCVLRFDFSGYGDSEGKFSDCTLDMQLNDIRCAEALVRSEIPSVHTVNYFGLRLGGTIALLAATSSKKRNTLILWEPVLDGEKFVQEVLRANLTSQLAISGKVTQTRADLVNRLRGGDSVNIEGYDLTYDVYEQIANVDILTTDLSDIGPGLVVQISRAREPRPAMERLTEISKFDCRVVAEEPFWREIRRFYGRAPNLFEATFEWLGDKA